MFFVICLTLNCLLGALVLVSLDTHDRLFYKWYCKDPFAGIGSFIVLQLWPITAGTVIWIKRKHGIKWYKGG